MSCIVLQCHLDKKCNDIDIFFFGILILLGFYGLAILLMVGRDVLRLRRY